MDRYEQLYALLMSVQDDFRKFYQHNNKSAGVRIRKGMLELRKLSSEVRQEVQDIKNDI
jgi:hypothetical protein